MRISNVILFSRSILFVCFFSPQFTIHVYGKNAYSVSLCFQNVMGLNIRGFIYLLILFHNTSRSVRRSCMYSLWKELVNRTV